MHRIASLYEVLFRYLQSFFVWFYNKTNYDADIFTLMSHRDYTKILNFNQFKIVFQSK